VIGKTKLRSARLSSVSCVTSQQTRMQMPSIVQGLAKARRYCSGDTKTICPTWCIPRLNNRSPLTFVRIAVTVSPHVLPNSLNLRPIDSWRRDLLYRNCSFKRFDGQIGPWVVAPNPLRSLANAPIPENPAPNAVGPSRPFSSAAQQPQLRHYGQLHSRASQTTRPDYVRFGVG